MDADLVTTTCEVREGMVGVYDSASVSSSSGCSPTTSIGLFCPPFGISANWGGGGARPPKPPTRGMSPAAALNRALPPWTLVSFLAGVLGVHDSGLLSHLHSHIYNFLLQGVLIFGKLEDGLENLVWSTWLGRTNRICWKFHTGQGEVIFILVFKGVLDV